MEQKRYNQSNTMYRGAVGASRIGYEKPPPSGTRSFMGNQYGQRRDFQTDKNQQVSNYSSGYSKNMNQRQTKDNSSSLKSYDRSAMVEYPVDIYPKSTLEDVRMNFSRQTDSQLRTDNRGNVDNRESFRNYQTNTRRSPVSSSRNDFRRNSMISDLNPEMNYRQLSPEPVTRVEYRTSRTEMSPEGNFRMDNRGGIWRSSPERFRENISSNSSFSQAANIPSLFDTNLRMQMAPASSAGQEIFTRRGNASSTPRMTEAERSLGYSSTVSAGLTEAERSLRFKPPPGQNRARNGRGRPNGSVRNETARPLIPALGRNRFEQPAANLIVGSSNVGAKLFNTSQGSTFTKPANVSKWPQNRKRKRNAPFQVKNENKKPKFEPPQTTLQQAAEVIKVLMDMKPTAVLSGTTLATGQISGASVPQVSAVAPAKKKKKKSKKKPKVANPTPPQLQDLKNLLAIVPRSFPMRKVKVEQSALLKNALLQEIENISDKSLKPHFVTSYRRRGSLMVCCDNNNAVEWLKNTIKTLQPWDGANLKVIRQTPQTFTWAVIVGDEFPKKSMTTEQLNALNEAITSKMDELADDKQPQFVDCFHRRGTLMVAYCNKEDFEWLKNTIQDLQPWDGAQLRLLDIDDVPTYNKIELWVPFSPTDFDKVLARLDRQNQGLNTGDWYVLRRRGKEGGHNLVVSVGDEVIEALEKIDYKPFLNFNRITVVNTGKVKKFPFTVSEYEEDLKRVKINVSEPPKAGETPGAPTGKVDKANVPK